MILFYYKSVSGVEIPHINHGTEEKLKADFKDSITPLTRIIHVNKDNAEALANVLQAQLPKLPKRACGSHSDTQSNLWQVRDTR